MRPGPDRTQPYWDAALCVFTLFAALVLYAAPTRLIDGTDLMPAWPLMAVFLWAGIRPRFMPPIVIFAVGLIQDLLTGSPMGVWALSFLAAMLITRFRGEDGMPRDLAPVWLRFCATLGIATLVAFAVGGWAVGGMADWRALGVETLASILTFPLLAFLAMRRRRSSRSGLIGG